MKKIIGLLALGVLVGTNSYARHYGMQNYELSITNGGTMPISPVLIYGSKANEPLVKLGDKATEGFKKICQTGDNSIREKEVLMDNKTVLVKKGNGLIFPGETKTFNLKAHPKHLGSINVETMYGKTKDTCGVINIDGQALSKLHYKVVSKVSGTDDVLATGAFTDPASENAAALCADAESGVACLRNLTEEGSGIVRAFPGYLPGVLSFIEKEYGSKDAQSLLVPTSGAIRYSLSVKR